jgi:hypothetical protein
MPNGGDVSLLEPLDPGDDFRRTAVQAAVLAKRLSVNVFSDACPERGQALGIRLGGRGFQKIKEPLRNVPVFS